jgi:hypothetical protein
MRSGIDDPGNAYAWDISNPIPGATNGDLYSVLNLASSGSGEQIYAFEASANPPLVHPSNHIFVLDMGDFSNPGFENVSSSGTGAIAPGLSLVANTAVTLPDPAFGNDANDFHNGSFALNMLDADVVALNSAGGTKEQWLALIADYTNWKKVNYEDDPEGDAEAQLSTLLFAGAPEPSRTTLLVGGLCLMMARRKRAV